MPAPSMLSRIYTTKNSFFAEIGCTTVNLNAKGRLIMTLIKKDLSNALFHQFDFTRTQSAQVVDSILEIIKQTLENGEEILITGFGRFYINKKRQRRGRNPKTGEDLMLEPRRVVKFRATEALRDKLNGKEMEA